MILTLVYDEKFDSFSCRRNGHLFVLSKRTDNITLNRNFILPMCADYMVVSRLGRHPKGWVVEKVLPDHLLVEHDGFAKWPDTGRTTAWASKHGLLVTPGRLNRTIYTADLSNVCRNSEYELFHPDGSEVPKLKPGLCYVDGRPTKTNIAKPHEGGWITPMLGVPCMDDLLPEGVVFP